MTRTSMSRTRSRRDAIVESSADAIVSVDMHGRVLDWNAAAESLFGWRASEIVGRPIGTIVPPERADETAWLIEHVRRGDPIRALETVRLARDGRRLRVSVTTSPVLGDGDELAGLSSIYRDVTIDERLRFDLQRSAAYLQAVLAGMDSGIVLSDAAGRIVYANRPFADLSGSAEERLVGAMRAEVLHGMMEHLREPEPLLRLADSEPSVEGEIEFVLERPEPGVFRWSSRAVPLPDGAGRLDVVRDVTNETQLREMYMRQAVTDPLTNLLNRLGGHQTIAREVARARRHGSPLSFAMFDIDHFKRVNDEHGHGVGDDVLREVADLVVRSIRGDDALIRWGGEEFLLVLPGARVEQARDLARRLRAKVAGIALEGLPPVTISIGVAELGAEDSGAEAAIERADRRMYSAKAAGRDRVE
jgi:diguanylate cyclase (GGDEF)-like protein/PAS domain S-box-containing protein